MQGWIWQELHCLDSVVNWGLADLSYYCYSFCAICPAYWPVSLNAGYVKGTVNKKLLIVGFSTPVKGAYSRWVAVDWYLLMLNLSYQALAVKGPPSADLHRAAQPQLKDRRNTKSQHWFSHRRVQSRWVLISAGSHSAAPHARAAVPGEARQAGGPAGSTGLSV